MSGWLLVVCDGEPGELYASAEADEVLDEGALDQLYDLERAEGRVDYLEDVRI